MWFCFLAFSLTCKILLSILSAHTVQITKILRTFFFHSLPYTVLNSLESNKFKLFKFIPLDDLDIARCKLLFSVLNSVAQFHISQTSENLMSVLVLHKQPLLERYKEIEDVPLFLYLIFIDFISSTVL